MKVCNKCKVKKLTTDFYKAEGYYSSPCKECRRKKVQERYHGYGKNLIKIYEYKRARNPNRQEKLKIYRKNWIENNPEKLKQLRQDYSNKKKQERRLRGLKKSGFKKGHKGFLTKAHYKRISEHHKGNTYSLGFKHSEDQRKQKSERQKGEKSHFWQGGLTSINAKIRNSFEFKLWREAVFKRDNYTCVWCGKVGSELNADHIKRFSDYPELRFVIENGRTLCVPCHKKTDTWGNNYRGKNGQYIKKIT